MECYCDKVNYDVINYIYKQFNINKTEMDKYISNFIYYFLGNNKTL